MIKSRASHSSLLKELRAKEEDVSKRGCLKLNSMKSQVWMSAVGKGTQPTDLILARRRRQTEKCDYETYCLWVKCAKMYAAQGSNLARGKCFVKASPFCCCCCPCYNEVKASPFSCCHCYDEVKARPFCCCHCYDEVKARPFCCCCCYCYEEAKAGPFCYCCCYCYDVVVLIHKPSKFFATFRQCRLNR